MIKAVIFDMDGVLFDTEGFYYRRRETFLKAKGISISHMIPKDFVGGRLDQVWEKILQDRFDTYDVDALENEYIDYKNNHRAPYKEDIFPDVKQVLKSLHDQGIKLALASNSEHKDIAFALSETGISSYFSHVLSGSDFEEGKPNPAIYNAACEMLGVNKSDTFIIEDSQKGIEAGKNANIQVLAIRDRLFDVDQSQADCIFDNLTQILQELRKGKF